MGLFNQPFMSMLSNAAGDVQIEQPLAPPRPSTPMDEHIPVGNPPIDVTLHGTQSTLQDMIDKLQQGAQGLSAGMQKAAQGSTGGSVTGGLLDPTKWLLSSRVVSGAVGLIAIGAGLMMFQGSRDVIINTAKTAAKVAV
jgi:hypothetical protein